MKFLVYKYNYKCRNKSVTQEFLVGTIQKHSEFSKKFKVGFPNRAERRRREASRHKCLGPDDPQALRRSQKISKPSRAPQARGESSQVSASRRSTQALPAEGRPGPSFIKYLFFYKIFIFFIKFSYFFIKYSYFYKIFIFFLKKFFG